MESAVALTNAIKKLADETKVGRPSQEQVVACLKGYQASREVRAEATVEVSTFATRVQALATFGHSIFANYGINVLGSFLGDLASDISVGAPLLDFLPPPELSLKGHLPFNPEQGSGHKESLLKRALFALPFLAIAGYGCNVLSSSGALAGVGNVANSNATIAGFDVLPAVEHFSVTGLLDRYPPATTEMKIVTPS